MVEFQPRRSTRQQFDLPPRVEEVHKWEVGTVTADDIPGIRNLFRKFLNPQIGRAGYVNLDSHHVFHEDINNFPKDWDNENQVDAFDTALTRFYLPDGPFDVQIPESTDKVNVERKSITCKRDGVVAGVYSYLTDDPYTTQSDRRRAAEGRLKMAYGHVLLVASELRNEKVGTMLVAQVADQVLMNEGYDQLTSCIDRQGDWGTVMDFTKRLGFEEGRRNADRYTYTNREGVQIEGRRIILKREDWGKIRNKVVTELNRKWNVSS